MTALEGLQAITARIVRHYHPLQIILFGSRARGDAGPWSDVDLLVVLPRVDDTWEAKRDIQSELEDLQPTADITVTTPDEIRRRGDLVGTVLRPALREGRVVYGKLGRRRIPEVPPMTEAEVQKEVAQWLVFAEDDLAAAELFIDKPEIVPRIAGFQAQQAAELALKAVYIFVQVQYPLTHNLDELRDGIPSGWGFTVNFPHLRDLSLWAIAQRYPGVQGQMTREDARQHVRQARDLLEAVKQELREHGFTGSD